MNFSRRHGKEVRCLRMLAARLLPPRLVDQSAQSTATLVAFFLGGPFTTLRVEEPLLNYISS